MRERFTAKGRIRQCFGGRTFFQVMQEPDGRVLIWTVGPMGWPHDFQFIPAGTSFDDAQIGRAHV